MLVIYESKNEIFVCQLEEEQYILSAWFSDKAERLHSDFVRSERLCVRIVTLPQSLEVQVA